ncbi:hypothetical protein EJ02DRAFT_185844 [Clathrospora elynae]|uniref:Uncharacterized protein n=1 Tax=Clathrospora elynae TaxID=706981 RepID=A0A6A5SMW5_9PLEO|nr:hypothetical protein EJ02DRAFT_185844 [Clathrospora elynae]
MIGRSRSAYQHELHSASRWRCATPTSTLRPASRCDFASAEAHLRNRLRSRLGTYFLVTALCSSSFKQESNSSCEIQEPGIDGK